MIWIAWSLLNTTILENLADKCSQRSLNKTCWRYSWSLVSGPPFIHVAEESVDKLDKNRNDMQYSLAYRILTQYVKESSGRLKFTTKWDAMYLSVVRDGATVN